MNFIGAMLNVVMGDPFKNVKVIEIDVSTPQEFLKDNTYCISEATAQMFKEAWEYMLEEIKDHQDIIHDIGEDGEDNGWTHKGFYKTLNYKYSNFC